MLTRGEKISRLFDAVPADPVSEDDARETVESVALVLATLVAAREGAGTVSIPHIASEIIIHSSEYAQRLRRENG